MSLPVPRRHHAPPVRPRIDFATGQAVCWVCEADLSEMSARARFCSHRCRSIYHMRGRRAAERRRRLALL